MLLHSERSIANSCLSVPIISLIEFVHPSGGLSIARVSNSFSFWCIGRLPFSQTAQKTQPQLE